MGLDMYLYKINKKVNTEKEVKTINEVIKLNGGNKFEELEKVVGFIKNNDDESYINSDYKMFINEFKNVYMSIKDKPKDELDNKCILSFTQDSIFWIFSGRVFWYFCLINSDAFCHANVDASEYPPQCELQYFFLS